MIVLIDYSVGNVKSVRNALDFLGIEDKLSADPADIENADGIILPGVAAFGYAMDALGETAEIVKKVAAAGKPLLGICVGFQVLFDSSNEMGNHTGLGLIKGTVGPIPPKPGLTIPHMGWNLVRPEGPMDLFADLKKDEHFYFAHSFCATVTDPDAKIAYTDYGSQIATSVQKGNIFGAQFHPEKSGPVGMKVLQTFDKICKGNKE